MSRPSDIHDDAFEAPKIVNPDLGPLGWLRWAWRQLTSMRTALLLLLALAVAAVPGSLIPQESSDPNGVIAWKAGNKTLVSVVEALQGFDVYTSVWFSAIYLLLFVSLVGCVIPRIRHHFKALRAAPPKTPARLSRLPGYRRVVVSGDREQVVAAAERVLRARRYRVRRYGDSVSAERGYLRETGNLVFHSALVGILVSVFVGGGFAYTGNRVLVADGETFVNNESGYDSLTKGRFFTDGLLQDYSIALKNLTVKYEDKIADDLGEPLDYTATVVTTMPGQPSHTTTIKVNHPIEIGGTKVYLLGNGYAPHITVRNAAGKIAFQGAVPFIPQNANLTSFGVVKVPDGFAKNDQIGMIGFFYPTAEKLTTGALSSNYPDLENPVLTLNVYEGNLGLDSGVPSNVYSLDTTGLKQLAGPPTKTAALEMTPGQTVDLPGGRGTVTFDKVGIGGVLRFASLDIHHDPSENWVFAFAVLTLAGLIVSLLIPRRRMWLSVAGEDEDGLVLEYAALARGDDPGLEKAVAEFAEAHRDRIEPGTAREPVRTPM